MTDDTKADSAIDMRPIPPIAPTPDRCCHSGCGESCVEEVYLEELRVYRIALQAWESRQSGGA